MLLSFLNLTKKKTKHKDKHEDKRQKTKYKVQSTKYKVQSTNKGKSAKDKTTQPRPTRPAVTPLKNNSNNLIQKIKQKLPIQPKITTSTTVIPKTKSKPQNTQPKTPGPYDPQNPYKEPQSGPKDIRGKDIEKDLIDNNPSEGSQTDMDTQER